MTQTNLQNEHLRATFRHHGAELVSLQAADGREYMWEGNPEIWGKHAPVLFPIVGTLKNNQYRWDGKSYSLGRHGFARDRVFEVERQSDTEVVFLLTDDVDTKAVYPFSFEFRIRYKLERATLAVTYEVRNTGNADLCFSVGGHPAFALPKPFSSYTLAITPPGRLTFRLLHRDLLSDTSAELDAASGEVPLEYRLFENDALVFTGQGCERITVREEGRDLLSVDVKDFPDLGLWTKSGAPFLCIEPWHGYADTESASGELGEKEGIRRLATGAVFETTYAIHVHTS